MPEEGYTGVTLPKSVVEAVKNEVEVNPLYSSISEFVKEAIRLRLDTAIQLREKVIKTAAGKKQ